MDLYDIPDQLKLHRASCSECIRWAHKPHKTICFDGQKIAAKYVPFRAPEYMELVADAITDSLNYLYLQKDIHGFTLLWVTPLGLYIDDKTMSFKWVWDENDGLFLYPQDVVQLKSFLNRRF